MSEVAENKEKTVATTFGPVSEQMMRDAFAALFISLTTEFMMSGDTKAIVIFRMYKNMEKMGYSEEELQNFKEKVYLAFNTFHKANDFMG